MAKIDQTRKMNMRDLDPREERRVSPMMSFKKSKSVKLSKNSHSSDEDY